MTELKNSAEMDDEEKDEYAKIVWKEIADAKKDRQANNGLDRYRNLTLSNQTPGWIVRWIKDGRLRSIALGDCVEIPRFNMPSSG